MKLFEFYHPSKTVLLEGGNVFDGTAPFDHELVPSLLKQLDDVLSTTGVKAMPIGSGANPTPGKQMGDLDIIVDAATLVKHFGVKDVKTAKQELEKLFAPKYDTAKSGQSVHVKLPTQAGPGAQVDIMVVPNAEKVAAYHKHNIPQGSEYKGKHKQIAMSKLAKPDYKWSGFKGLIHVESDPKGENPITDLDEIAKILLGDHAKASDLGSMESILAALPQEKADELMADLSQDTQFNK